MVVRFDQHKNFITLQECAELNAWVEDGVARKWLDSGIGKEGFLYNKRLTSRIYADRYIYPDIVHKLALKIREFCGLSSYKIIEKHGRDGVVVSCILPGGNLYAHCDPKNVAGLSALRCNILTRAADSGGVLHLEGEPKPLEVGELHCYLASKHEHYVSEVEGNTSRVLWMFGAYVPEEDWDSGLIKVGR
tara:strand:+ start:322 stop:891 length:570 start_codon:yes stop_codon:yes gene_type:complete